MDCSIPGFPVLHCLPEFAQTSVRWVDDAMQPSPTLWLLFSFCPQYFPVRVFSSELVLGVRWPKYWSLWLSIGPSNECSAFTCFRIDWFHLLAAQWTHKGLRHHHRSEATVLWCSAFFVVQLSYPYMTTWIAIALTTWTFVSKVMSIPSLKMLCRFVIAFLPYTLDMNPYWIWTQLTVANVFSISYLVSHFIDGTPCRGFRAWCTLSCSLLLLLPLLLESHPNFMAKTDAQERSAPFVLGAERFQWFCSSF